MSILALTSNTLIGTPAAGNIEYNGQFFGTDSAASRAQLQRITSGTAVASTSGTSIDFTSLPAWVKRITVMFNGVSTSGTGVRIQLGSSGGIESTGYTGDSVKFESSNVHTASASGFDLGLASAATAISGLFVLTTLGSNLWVISGTVGSTNVATANIIGGSKTLSGTLDRVRITTVNGTDTFDAGSVNILYEG